MFSLLKADGDVPYIYFYSREDNGFVVMRADGEDRRLLASYIFTEDYFSQMGVYGPGWSPSGEHFAWMVHSSEGGSPSSLAKDLYIVDAEGTTISTVSIPAEQAKGIEDAQWSPIDELLLILAYDVSDIGTAILTIYDPETDTDVLSYTFPNIPRHVDSVTWSSDGRSIVVVSGYEVQFIPLDGSKIIDIASYPLFSSLVHEASRLVSTALKDRFIYGSKALTNGLLLDWQTSETTPLIPVDDVLIDVTRIDVVRWHASGDWMFLLSRYNALAHVKVANTSGQVWPELALCPPDSQSCFGWMP
jgi:hypothetical protein